MLARAGAGAGRLSPAPAGQPARTVAMCGDDATALGTAAELIRDLGAVPAVIGGLEHARQLEDVAGFVMRLVAAGCNPVTAVPFVDLGADDRSRAGTDRASLAQST